MSGRRRKGGESGYWFNLTDTPFYNSFIITQQIFIKLFIWMLVAFTRSLEVMLFNNLYFRIPTPSESNLTTFDLSLDILI